GTHHAIDQETGAMRWELADRLISSVPAAARDGFLYLASDRGSVHALIGATGAHAWRTLLPEMPFGSCATTDELVLVPVMTRSGNRCLFALDRTSGELMWSYDAGCDVIAGHASATARSIYLALVRERQVHILDHDGVKKWEIRTASSVACAPLLHRG